MDFWKNLKDNNTNNENYHSYEWYSNSTHIPSKESRTLVEELPDTDSYPYDWVNGENYSYIKMNVAGLTKDKISVTWDKTKDQVHVEITPSLNYLAMKESYVHKGNILEETEYVFEIDRDEHIVTSVSSYLKNGILTIQINYNKGTTISDMVNVTIED